MMKGPLETNPAKKMEGLILISFFFSEVCGLIYVITWTQILRHSLGPPLFSIISILTIFLGGLTLGSYITGRYIDIRRPDPLKVYGLLVGTLGIYSLFLPWFIQGMTLIHGAIYQNVRFPFYSSFFLRYLIYTPILLIPSALIGATWPVMSKLLILSMDRLGWTMGKIFGVNTLGGAFGVLATRFLLLPHLGANHTIYLGAIIDLIIGINIFILYKKSRSWQIIPEGFDKAITVKDALPKKDNRYGDVRRIILIGYGLSCFAAMVYLAVWSKALIIFLESSLSALTLISSTFLMGLAIGSLGLGKFIDQRTDQISLLGTIEIVIGLSCLGIIPLLDGFPLFMALIIKRLGHSFWLLQLSEFLLILLIIMIPALLLGLAFPLICRMYSDQIKSIGKSISTVFVMHAFGSLIGVLFGGILLSMWLGTKRGSLVAVWSHIFIGCLFLLLGFSLPRIKKTALLIVVAGSFIVFSFFIPLWEMPLFKAEPYRYAYYVSRFLRGKGSSQRHIPKKKTEKIFSKNGIVADVTVIKEKEEISIQINGVMECSSTRDLPAQVLSAHIPLLLQSNPEDILLIGIGSGITLGSLEQYPLREIDCVEISRGMIEASGYFHELNHQALEDPRLHVMIEDGRHHLMFTDKQYDLIISQPLSAWPEAINEFFTKECFQLFRERLKSGGTAAIRLPARKMKPEIFQSVICTWHEVFPFVQLWETDLGTDYLLIGSDHAISWDYPLITDRSEKEGIASDLGRLKIKDPPIDLLSFYFMDKQGIASCCPDSKVFTDKLVQTGFIPLKLANKETPETLLEEMQDYRGKGLSDLLVRPQEIDASEFQIIKEKIDNALIAKRYLGKAYIDLIKNEPRDKVLNGLKVSLRKNPDDRKAIELYCDILFSMATDYTNQKQFNWALWTINEIIRIMPDNTKARYLLGKTYYNMNLLDQAVEEFEKVVKYQPDDEESRCHLGMAYLNKGWIDLSIVQFDHAIGINPDYAEAHLYLGAAYFKKDLIYKAIEAYENAIALRHDYADAHYNLGIAYLKEGLIDEAIKEWKEVIRIRPNEINGRYNLAMAYFNHGEIKQSIALLEELLSIKPDYAQARSLLQALYQMRKE
ncbi:MAG: fused MFS/spermidine synthase [bacterium]